MGKTIIFILIAVSLIGASLSVPLLDAGAGPKYVGLTGGNNVGHRDGSSPPNGPPPAGGPPAGGPPAGGSPPGGPRPSGPPPSTTASSG